MALEYFPPRRGRPRYHPKWHEGEENKEEEARWPYVMCILAHQQVFSQNIGYIKKMARDKAKNTKTPVPVILHLPDGTENTILFMPDGKQVVQRAERSKYAERREPAEMKKSVEPVRVPAPDADGNRRVQRVTESYLQDAAERDYSDAAKRELQRRNRGRDRDGDPGGHDGRPECGGD